MRTRACSTSVSSHECGADWTPDELAAGGPWRPAARRIGRTSPATATAAGRRTETGLGRRGNGGGAYSCTVHEYSTASHGVGGGAEQATRSPSRSGGVGQVRRLSEEAPRASATRPNRAPRRFAVTHRDLAVTSPRSPVSSRTATEEMAPASSKSVRSRRRQRTRLERLPPASSPPSSRQSRFCGFGSKPRPREGERERGREREKGRERKRER